jgi:hypothetical protein
MSQSLHKVFVVKDIDPKHIDAGQDQLDIEIEPALAIEFCKSLVDRMGKLISGKSGWLVPSITIRVQGRFGR